MLLSPLKAAHLKPMESTDRSTLKAVLMGLSWVLFFIAGMTLLVAGSAISDFAKVNRTLAEVVGDSIALLIGGLGYILKRVARDLGEAQGSSGVNE